MVFPGNLNRWTPIHICRSRTSLFELFLYALTSHSLLPSSGIASLLFMICWYHIAPWGCHPTYCHIRNVKYQTRELICRKSRWCLPLVYSTYLSSCQWKTLHRDLTSPGLMMNGPANLVWSHTFLSGDRGEEKQRKEMKTFLLKGFGQPHPSGTFLLSGRVTRKTDELHMKVLTKFFAPIPPRESPFCTSILYLYFTSPFPLLFWVSPDNIT